MYRQMLSTGSICTKSLARALAYSRRNLSFTSASKATVAVDSSIASNNTHSDVVQLLERPTYWAKIPRWSQTSEEDFLNYRWQSVHSIKNNTMEAFLREVLPSTIPGRSREDISREDLIADVNAGMLTANMTMQISPHIASLIQWSTPLQCPIFRQFIASKSSQIPDRAYLGFDSLNEQSDSPAEAGGHLVHRYKDRVLFLATKTCPVYCRFCTRSYGVGTKTLANAKTGGARINPEKISLALDYIQQHGEIRDVVVSGGDAFHLAPKELYSICSQLLAIPHIRELRIASKGLAVCPSRFLDPFDNWYGSLVKLSDEARHMDKEVALHTHFNTAQEVTWVTRQAARRLFQAGVTVRNQSVLLRDVNDSTDAMSALIRGLAEMHIQPLYVYQADMVKGTEDLRTPLSTALSLEKELRGTIAGHRMPSFVLDLPGGGGKRLVSTYDSYNESKGSSIWSAPGVRPGRAYHYHDPLPEGV